MSSLSSILTLSSKKLVLENFHLLCYILSYAQTPLSCKMVHYLLQINKYYNTLVNKLLSRQSYSTIFPVEMTISDSDIDMSISILTCMSITSSVCINGITPSSILKAVNIIIMYSWENSLLRCDQLYIAYKRFFDTIISTCNSASSDASSSSRTIDRIQLFTRNHKIIRYTLDNIHKTKVKHLFIVDQCDYKDEDLLNISSNNSNGSKQVNNELLSVRFNWYHSATYMIQFIKQFKLNKLTHLEINNGGPNIEIVLSDMPMLTNVNIVTSIMNASRTHNDDAKFDIDNNILANLKTFKNCNSQYVSDNIDSMINLTELDIPIHSRNISILAFNLPHLTSLKVHPFFYDQNGTFRITALNMKILKTLILFHYNYSINGLFDNLTSLTHLEIPNYLLHYQREEVLPSLPNLTYINVPHCDEVKAPFFQNINNLRELYVSHGYNKLGLYKEKMLANLTSLHISDGVLDDKSISENIAIYTSLTSLSLTSIIITIDKSVFKVNPLSSLVNLTELSFDNCHLDGVKLDKLSLLFPSFFPFSFFSFSEKIFFIFFTEKKLIIKRRKI